MKTNASILSRITAGALVVLLCATPSVADDAARTVALFANTEWAFKLWYTDNGSYMVKFFKDGRD